MFLPYLESLYKDHRDKPFVEPFCGGCSLALGLEPDIALLNDWSPHLINFWWEVQMGFEIDLQMINDRDVYYQYRDEFNTRILAYEYVTKRSAELFYYLNKTCFNGLWRVNKKGRFNVPFGKYAQINYQYNFREYESLLSPWTFLFGDFEDIQWTNLDGAFIYADPPYDDGFTQYTADGFNWPDQVRLARWLAGRNGPVVASNRATPRIVKLYQDLGFDLEYRNGAQNISSAGNRNDILEMVATRNL